MVTKVDQNTVSNVYETEQMQKSSNVSGKTIGDPKLSEKASKYYEKLKNKFSNMDFILVSEDQKETAKAQAGSYANPNRMVVLIDEEKLEKMASDESYRKNYENIIATAGTQIPQLKSALGATSSKVKTFGIQVNDDGTTSFFAVIKKNNAAHVKRMQERKKAKKAEEKMYAKKAEEKRAAQKAEEKKANQRNHTYTDLEIAWEDDNKLTSQLNGVEDSEETITISATSVEGLFLKIKEMEYDDLSNQIQTEREKQVGQNIDFRM